MLLDSSEIKAVRLKSHFLNLSNHSEPSVTIKHGD